ncbi:MAG: glutamine--scyllo-inositol aminotransferase [Thermoprotei archaeon]|nr:MAG: glutamine--scyllo-inositol aminotransferase [Thermoprotei archaeon]RLF03127.1 MAG: glutamine--scyllo-inositol aminotransferase [Thermoprotei archaeon]
MSEDKLAIDGGEPVIKKKLILGYPGALTIDEREERAVLEVIRSKSLFRYYGPNPLFKVKEFEEKFAKYIGCKYTLAVTSGTAALIVAVRSLGVKEGDQVIVPAYAWISTPVSVVLNGGEVVVVGVDESLNIDPTAIEYAVSEKVKVVIPVHMRGVPANMEGVMKVARDHDLKVVEDVAQACGGSFKGKKLGAIGDAGIFSFQLNKNMTAGEGGAVTTSNEEIYKRAVAAHDVAAYYRNPKYVPPMPSPNFRLNELSAAVLIEQLDKLDRNIARMKELKKIVKEAVEQSPGLELRKIPDEEGDTACTITFFLKSSEKALKFAKALSAEGVPAGVICNPENPYEGHIWVNWKVLLGKKMIVHKESCEKALDLLSRGVSIGLVPVLSTEDAELIAKAIKKVAMVIH